MRVPAGAGRALALHASGAGEGTVTLALPIPRAGKWQVTPRLLVGGRPDLALAILAADGAVLAAWTPADTDAAPPAGSAGARACIDLPPRLFSTKDDHELRIAVIPPHDAPHLVALDRFLLSPASR